MSVFEEYGAFKVGPYTDQTHIVIFVILSCIRIKDDISIEVNLSKLLTDYLHIYST